MKTKVTIIIPSRQTDNIKSNIKNIIESKYPIENIEIYHVTGTHPTKQRNQCIKEASGDIIYFLDNDSIIENNNIQYAIDIFNSDSNIAIVGGPAVHTITTKKEEDINICLSSFFCVGPIKSRYTKKNIAPFDCSDKDLILCNIFIRKDILEKMNYFNENLYPNEENELIDKVILSGYRIIHHPNIVVYRPPRSNLKEYIKMLTNYGRGRLEQMKENFSLKNIIFSLPMFFMFYILSIPILFFVFLKYPINILYISPLLFYILIAFVFSLEKSIKRKSGKLRSLFIMPIMFFLTHFFYGFGFFYGIIKNLFKKKKEIIHNINIKKIKEFN